MKCKKCGVDISRLKIFALREDLGGDRMHPSPEVCPESNGEHDFEREEDRKGLGIRDEEKKGGVSEK